MKSKDSLTQPPSPNYTMLVPLVPDEDKRAQKDRVYRLAMYATWLDDNGRTWREPALDKYRDYLLDTRGLAPSTVIGQLATIRSRFRSLLKSGAVHAALRASKDERFGEEMSPDEINDIVKNIRRAISVQSTRVKMPEAETEYLRLTKDHVLQLLKDFDDRLKEFDELVAGLDDFSVDIDEYPLVRVRDRAIFALMYTTGLRESELCAVEVPDLRYQFDGKPALHVPKGQGCTERLIPYGGLIWGLEYVDKWLLAAKITTGPVFRGFYKGGSLRPSGLSLRALEYILASYPITIDGEEVKIRPMDLRRAYTRLLYESGMELAAIRENLGVRDFNTVLDYIGPVAQDTRIPPSIQP